MKNKLFNFLKQNERFILRYVVILFVIQFLIIPWAVKNTTTQYTPWDIPTSDLINKQYLVDNGWELKYEGENWGVEELYFENGGLNPKKLTIYHNTKDGTARFDNWGEIDFAYDRFAVEIFLWVSDTHIEEGFFKDMDSAEQYCLELFKEGNLFHKGLAMNEYWDREWFVELDKEYLFLEGKIYYGDGEWDYRKVQIFVKKIANNQMSVIIVDTGNKI